MFNCQVGSFIARLYYKRYTKLWKLFKRAIVVRKNSSIILGIETSCDDTGVAVVNEKGNVLGESLFSQQKIHTDFGGIIPPIAKDLHVENIQYVTTQALENSHLNLSQIDAIAVTVKPGLPLSLLVGMNHAKQLALKARKPIIPIHHMEAHALTIRLIEKVGFPFLVLLISGGHCLIAIAQDIEKFLLLGKSIDDSPGEAFDKVVLHLVYSLESVAIDSHHIARRLKLHNLEEFSDLSGGAAIEKAAKEGDVEVVPITEPLLRNKDCNFSFSGIKNSSRKFILQEEEKYGIEGDGIIPSFRNLCAAVQFVTAKHLCRRLQRAMTFAKVNNLIPDDYAHLVVSGGVASNAFIARAIRVTCDHLGYKCHFPPPALCTDNGVMIAWNGVERWLANKGVFSYTELDKIDIQGKCPLGQDITKEVEESNLKISWIPPKYFKSALKI